VRDGANEESLVQKQIVVSIFVHTLDCGPQGTVLVAGVSFLLYLFYDAAEHVSVVEE
jgi:hypothetical protein